MSTFTIGEFSRLTHLPVKTLHHYHDVGVLVPAEVDPVTGYRRYSPGQVADAHLVRRLRDVRMPPAEIRAVLRADGVAREAGIAAHLERLHRSLTETATAVASLQALLTGGPAHVPVREVELPAQTAVATSADLDAGEITAFCAEAYPRLFASMGRLGAVPAGPGAALYDPQWFADGAGRVTVYVPVSSAADPGAVTTIPGGRFAVALHAGGFDRLDVTYGALGRHVLDAGIGADGPIREIYLVTPADTTDPAQLRTEVLWPIH